MPACAQKCQEPKIDECCRTCLLQCSEPVADQTTTSMLTVGDSDDSDFDGCPMMNGGW